jgi:hypothetical protein
MELNYWVKSFVLPLGFNQFKKYKSIYPEANVFMQKYKFMEFLGTIFEG